MFKTAHPPVCQALLGICFGRRLDRRRLDFGPCGLSIRQAEPAQFRVLLPFPLGTIARACLRSNDMGTGGAVCAKGATTAALGR